MATPTEGAPRLRAWLDSTATSQTELARLLGVEQPSVARWVGGGARPDPHLRRALAVITTIPETAWETDAERAQVARAIEASRAGEAA